MRSSRFSAATAAQQFAGPSGEEPSRSNPIFCCSPSVISVVRPLGKNWSHNASQFKFMVRTPSDISGPALRAVHALHFPHGDLAFETTRFTFYVYPLSYLWHVCFLWLAAQTPIHSQLPGLRHPRLAVHQSGVGIARCRTRRSSEPPIARGDLPSGFSFIGSRCGGR